MTTLFSLPMVNIVHIPVSVELKLPAFGSVKTLLSICYIVYNRTPFPQEIEITMEASDSFMFSGNKQVLQLTRPHSSVSNVSDCRSRGSNFDPGLVPYIHYTPRKHCLWWVYCFHVIRPCVCPCVLPSVRP